jgi:hypothetical protein
LLLPNAFRTYLPIDRLFAADASAMATAKDGIAAVISAGSPATASAFQTSRCRRLPALVGKLAAAIFAFMPIVCCSQSLPPAEVLDRYLNSQSDRQPGCSGSVYAVQIDASLPRLKKHGTMTGFKRLGKPGQTIYRGLRFTGDGLIKTQVIARFLAHDTNPPEHAEDIAVTPRNYIFTFNRALDYNGLTAYVFLLKPRRKRTGLFRGELWLESATAAPLRIWGDLVKSPSIFVRSIRFVEDYQTVCGCTEALRLLLTARTRIAGTVEMTVWTHAVSQDPDAEDDLNADQGTSPPGARHSGRSSHS